MLQIKIKKDEYDKIQVLLPDICPDVSFYLKVEDGNLVALGFCDRTPCIVEFKIGVEEFKKMLDELSQIEIEAFDTLHGTYPSESSPAYQKYLKYGCLYDILYNAEIITAE